MRLAALAVGVVHGRWAVVEIDSAEQERIEAVGEEKRPQEAQMVMPLVEGRAEVGMRDGLEVRLVGMEECPVEMEERLAETLA